MNEFDKARKELLQHYSRVIQVLNDSTLLDSLGFVEVNMMRLGNEISKYAGATGAYFIGRTGKEINGYIRKHLTKKEVLKALDLGNKVKHSSFTEGEWMCLSRNLLNYIFEDGCVVSTALFWRDRAYDSWQDGWSIVEPK